MGVIVALRDPALRNAWLKRAAREGLDIVPFDGLPRLYHVRERRVADFPLSDYPEFMSVDDEEDEVRGTQALTFSDNFLSGDSWSLARHTRRNRPWVNAGLRLPFSTSFDCIRDGTGVDIYSIDTGVATHDDLTGRVSLVYGVADDHGHGTAVMSVAAGNTVGFARGALVWSCKALASSNTGTVSSTVNAISAAVSHYNGRLATNRPAVMNLSLTMNGSVSAALTDAMTAGIVVVAAAGNDGKSLDTEIDLWPAETPGAICVGGTMPNDGPASYTNFGTRVDVLAGAFRVMAAKYTGGFEAVNGTSFAAPAVTGAIACILQDYTRLTSLQMTQRVKAFIRDNGTWGRYKPSLAHTPMNAPILFLDPTNVYPYIEGLPRR